MATLIKTDGTREEIIGKDNDKLTLEQMQKAVGGYVESISLGGKFFLLVNEDGRMNKLPLNYTATVKFGMIIRGNALLYGSNEMK